MMVGKLELPAGFRFHPTDEELVKHYLCRRCASQSISVPIIAEIDLYKFDPWQLPDLALYGEKEWYFFSPRDRKYPNGSRPNRAAGTGYWKATGADKAIGRPKTVGIKKALVFYSGKAPKGVKTNWIMHEYRLANVDRSPGHKNSSRLDEWVLCRIYNKKGNLEKQQTSSPTSESLSEVEDRKPDILTSNMYTMTTQPMQHPMSTAAPAFNNYLFAEQSDSVAFRRQQPNSSCSEQVWSPEVESKAKWNNDNNNNYAWNSYMNSLSYGLFQDDQFSDPMQDMSMYMHNPPLM